MVVGWSLVLLVVTTPIARHPLEASPVPEIHYAAEEEHGGEGHVEPDGGRDGAAVRPERMYRDVDAECNHDPAEDHTHRLHVALLKKGDR